MRWNELFADIEIQFEQQLHAEQRDLAVEAARLNRARHRLIERLVCMSHGGDAVKIVLADARVIELSIDSRGADWIAGEMHLGERRRGAVVPIPAIASVLPTREQARRSDAEGSPPPTGLEERLGLQFVLRDLARRRIPVDLHTVVGVARGTIDRVGADHLDFVEQDAEGQLPLGRRMRLVPLPGILSVQV